MALNTCCPCVKTFLAAAAPVSSERGKSLLQTHVHLDHWKRVGTVRYIYANIYVHLECDAKQLSMCANFKQFASWINIITSLWPPEKGMKLQQLQFWFCFLLLLSRIRFRIKNKSLKFEMGAYGLDSSRSR
jgi:hypothetical protein